METQIAGEPTQTHTADKWQSGPLSLHPQHQTTGLAASAAFPWRHLRGHPVVSALLQRGEEWLVETTQCFIHHADGS